MFEVTKANVFLTARNVIIGVRSFGDGAAIAHACVQI